VKACTSSASPRTASVAELRLPAPPRRHLLSIAGLDRADVERVLDTAASMAASIDREVKKLPTLRGRTVVNLFYVSSTRTLASFELAAKRLSADTMSLRAAGSSVDKGESLKDTAVTLAAYDPDVIVVRHPSIGAPQLVARNTDAHVVNAGDGKHQHPTQALLDLYTLRQALGRLEGLHVAIVGDVLHSRVARSAHQALALVGGRTTSSAPDRLPQDQKRSAASGVRHRRDRRRRRRLRPANAARMGRRSCPRFASTRLCTGSPRSECATRRS
jgi:aspartate carbamoyltransferase catalytic subunit